MPRGIKAGRPNKYELVREAITTLGKDAMPVAIQKDIKAKHGIEVPPSLVSNYKYKVLAEMKKGGKSITSAPVATATPAANPLASGISLEDIRLVKALVDRIGGEKVEQLAKVLR
jgi:hypothetical protein